MDPATRILIEALHRAPGKCVLALTGGGAGAAARLLGVPGASRTVLEVVVPYDEQALSEYLGRRPEQFCSASTSRAMAVRAFDRARWLAPGESVLGLGCTATLATDRPKRGDHRFFLTAHRGASVTSALTLQKGARDRAGEEEVLDAVLLNALAEGLGIAERLTPALLPGERVEVETRPTEGALEAFLNGELAAVWVGMDGQVREKAEPPRVLVPGAFNPLHEAHWGLARAGARLTGGPVAFELSVTNVDKPALSAEEVRRRLGPFHWKAPVWLTRAPTFLEKAARFPGVTFAVGADTAARIIAPRYYGGNEERLAAALAELRGRGCRLLVAGRADEQGKFLSLEDLAVPPGFRDLFRAIPRDEFRMDVSSTRLRQDRPGQEADADPTD